MTPGHAEAGLIWELTSVSGAARQILPVMSCFATTSRVSVIRPAAELLVAVNMVNTCVRSLTSGERHNISIVKIFVSSLNRVQYRYFGYAYIAGFLVFLNVWKTGSQTSATAYRHWLNFDEESEQLRLVFISRLFVAFCGVS